MLRSFIGMMCLPNPHHLLPKHLLTTFQLSMRGEMSQALSLNCISKAVLKTLHDTKPYGFSMFKDLEERVSNQSLRMNSIHFSSVTQCVQVFVTPWTGAHEASLIITNSQNLLNLMSSSWWCHPTISSSVISFSSCLQSFPASGSFQMSQFFASEEQSHGFRFSISPFNQHSGLISFRMD